MSRRLVVNQGIRRVRKGSDVKNDKGSAPVGLLVALGVVVAGGAAGVVLQRSGAVDPVGEDTVVAAYAEASFFDCPSGDALGVFVRGDRVYLVGRDDTGGWVQVRSPRDTDQRVWIAADQVAADAVIDLDAMAASAAIALPASTALSQEPDGRRG